jgi:predicted nucleic acid-binding protein
LSVFVDTSGFLAVLDTGESNHRYAAEAWLGLLREDALLITTNYVVVETIALLHQRFGVGLVRRFSDDVLPAVSILWVDEQTHSMAIRSVIAGSRRGPSLVDCVSFRVIASSEVQSVFAYDRHFADRGYNLCGQGGQG